MARAVKRSEPTRGINRPLLPRNRAPIVKRLPNRGQKRKSEQKEDLPNEHAAHGYFFAAALARLSTRTLE